MRKLLKHRGVYQRRDRRYVVRVRVTDSRTGLRRERRATLPPGATLAEAAQRQDDLAEETRAVPESVIACPSVTDYAETWVKRKNARGDWRDGGSTMSRVVAALDDHVLPELGELLVDRVTPRDLQRWMDGQLGSRARHSTIRQRWSTLRALLKDACAEFELRDPCIRIKPPKRPRRGGKSNVLAPVQIEALLAEVWERSHVTWYPLMRLGFATGARYGELAAARVDCFDLTGEFGVWHIRWHVSFEGARILPGTKAGPERPAHLDKDTTAYLRGVVAARRLSGGPNALLFTGAEPAGTRSRSLFARFLARACSSARVPVVSSKTFRQTRATQAALVELGDVAQEQLGHASKEMTEVYQRFSVDHHQAAAEKMAAALHLGPVGAAIAAPKGREGDA